MAVVGRLVGTFEPALVMVAIAQANSASASTNTIPPIQPASTDAGMNGNDTTHCRVSPTSTASAHAIGGRTMTLAVSAVSLMAGPVKTCARLDVCLLKTPLNPCGDDAGGTALSASPRRTQDCAPRSSGQPSARPARASGCQNSTD